MTEIRLELIRNANSKFHCEALPNNRRTPRNDTHEYKNGKWHEPKSVFGRGKEKVQITSTTWHVKVSYLIVCEGPSSPDKWWLIQCMWCRAQPLPAMKTRWMSRTPVIWFPFDGRKIPTTQRRGRRTGAAQTATDSKIGKHDSKDLHFDFDWGNKWCENSEWHRTHHEPVNCSAIWRSSWVDKEAALHCWRWKWVATMPHILLRPTRTYITTNCANIERKRLEWLWTREITGPNSHKPYFVD